jgi:amino acid adenylation domain-containing protein
MSLQTNLKEGERQQFCTNSNHCVFSYQEDSLNPHALDSQIAKADISATFIDVLRRHAENRSSRTAIAFIDNGVEENVTFAALDQRARAIASFLQKEKMEGQRALLLLPSGPEFISTFFGCLYAGVIAVPAFPFHFDGSRRGESWFRSVAADAQPVLAFATPEMIAKLPKANDPLVSGIRWISPLSIDLSLAEAWREPFVEEKTVAFLQYTSGSTSSPKGVMISHGNVLHNMKVIQTACNTGEDSTVVTWLPLYHDMGLIGTVLQPLYLGARCVLMGPITFLQKPVRWLQAITQYRAHSSSAPNFAYELCARKISSAEKTELDLSDWRVAVNGAEPVRPETMTRFAAAFRECGFTADAFYPSYGMAESTLMVTGGRKSRAPKFLRISAAALERNTVREPSSNEAARVLVGCGSTLSGQKIIIVDPNTLQPCDKAGIGEIWVNSRSVAQGYWNRPEETASVFHGQIASGGKSRFLRTGDLGFMADEQLFITGRLKDLIILRGRNLYPQDIELTVQQCHPSLRAGCGAAFTVEANGQEALVVMNEVDRHSEALQDKLFSEIRKAVLLEHGIQVYSLMLLKDGSLPKTTSGKIKRAACRSAFLAGEMEALASSTLPLPNGETAISGERLSRTDLLETEPSMRLELVESHLREQVAHIAKIDPSEISLDQSLIGIGLDSLGATELANRVGTDTGIQVEVASLLEGISLHRLAEVIVERIGVGEEPLVIQERSSKQESLPLSHGQKGLWILHKLAPNSVAYTLANAIRIQGRLDFNALEQAFLQVMERHEMLRAVFPAVNGEPTQLIQPIKDIAPAQHIRHIDLTEAESARMQERLAEEAQKPFPLEKMPPVRLFVFGLPTGDDVLMLVLHHIIADLWSIGTILQELSDAYQARCNGRSAELPGLKSSYPDFVEWQSEKISGADGAPLINYWSTHLAGELPVLQLPEDRPRPALFSYRGASESICLEQGLYRRVQDLARTADVTPFTFLVGAFQVLLHRISGQEDVLLGSPINGRSKPEFAPVVGYFVNPVVLRSYYDGTLPFSSYLAEVRQTVLQALKHQDYPFPLLVEHLHPTREGGLSPIFQAMFVWQELPGNQGEALSAASLGEARIPIQFAGTPAELVPLDNSGSQFDLTLLMTANGENLLASMKYNTDLFDQTTIQRLGSQFSVLLTAIVNNFQQQLSALPLMTPAERNHLLTQCSTGQPAPLLRQNTIHELFEREVERDPSAIALIVGEKRMTFGELNAQANRFARYLQTLGVKAESLVGVCLERSPEMIAGLLGIWKSGGVYVPLDTRDPRARLATMMEHTSFTALITHENFLDRLPEQLPPVVLLDLDLDVIAQEIGSNLNIRIDERSLAYVIHTSGSTGSPKGVMIEHRCLNNLFGGLTEAIYAEYSHRLIVGLNAPFTFDSSIKQLITLAMGQTLCLIPEEIRRNGAALLAYMQEIKIDVLDCTPTQVQLLLEAGLEDSENSTALLLGGEPIPEHIWNLLGKRRSKLCYNVYGPTECTVDATFCRIGPEQSPSIGRPLAGTSVYILDEHFQVAPIGVPGDIYIGGHNVGRGYMDRPDTTAERFLPDHLSANSGDRMYKTGDCGQWLANGSIRFLGRSDRQVKIRGFRIELGEVEAALRAQSGVQDAAAVAMDIGSGSKQLVAYVVAAEERAFNHYRQMLAETLPDYMLPVAVVAIASMPVNAHGKKDYKALRPPEVSELERNDLTLPQSPLEQYLVNLWTTTLRVQPIGIHDNFFALGGDSLQATKLITQIQQEYPSDMPLLALFFQEPTIASIARFISAQKNALVQSTGT